jgi:hypothetical protein
MNLKKISIIQNDPKLKIKNKKLGSKLKYKKK